MSSEVDRELERLFWPAPKRGRRREERGFQAAAALMLASQARTRHAAGAEAPSGAGLAGSALLRDELRAHLRRAPQVMVKITGKSRGLAGVRDHLEYIADGKPEPYEEREPDEEEPGRLGRSGEQRLKRAIVTESGERIEQVAQLEDLLRQWSRVPQPMPWTSERAEAIHIMWQMPPGTDAEKLFAAVQASARAEFQGHSYGMALHQHQSSPHVHMLVRVANDDGRTRLNPRKADLHRWRLRFAHELRERGIDAAASRQRTRGYAQRHEHLWERKMTERAERLQAKAARARALGRDGEADELAARASAVRRTEATRPRRESAATERQVQQARAQWLGLQKALASSPAEGDRELAKLTDAFVRDHFGDRDPGRETVRGR